MPSRRVGGSPKKKSIVLAAGADEGDTPVPIGEKKGSGSGSADSNWKSDAGDSLRRDVERELPPDEATPTIFDEAVLGGSCMEVYQPTASRSVEDRIQSLEPHEARPKDPPESCHLRRGSFQIDWRELIFDEKKDITSDEFITGAPNSSPQDSSYMAMAASGRRLTDGYQAIRRIVEEVGRVTAAGAIADIPGLLNRVGEIYDLVTIEIGKLLFGGTLGTIRGQVTCPFYVCTADSGKRHSLFVQHSERIGSWTQNDGRFEVTVRVSLDNLQKIERLTILPQPASDPNAARAKTFTCMIPSDQPGVPPERVNFTVPRPQGISGYTGTGSVPLRSRWAVIDVFPGFHTLDLVYTVRVAVSGAINDEFMKKIEALVCETLRFVRSATTLLRRLARAAQDAVTGGGGGTAPAGQPSIIDGITDSLKKGVQTALSALDTFLEAFNDTLAGFKARVEIPSSAVQLICLSTNDVETRTGPEGSTELVPRKKN